MRNSVILLPQLKICGVIGLMIVSLLFVGCEEAVNNQSSETVVNEPTQEILQEADDTENVVKTTWFNSEHQLTDIGLITVHQVDYTHSLLLLTDYETFAQKVNCNELFCGHNSESCPAFILHGSSTDTGGFLYTYNKSLQNRLYVVVRRTSENGEISDDNPPEFYIFSLDGKTRTKLTKEPPEEFFAYSERALYYLKHDGEKGVFDINSYDINTGETETILQTQINENLNLITAKDDVMYFTHTINDGTAIESVSLKSYNVTTKEQKTIAVLDEYIDDSYGLPVYATGETAYFSSNEFSSIYKVDLTNGQIVTLSDSWPDISAVKNPEPNYILNGKRYLNQLIKDENGDDILLLTSDSHGVNGEENIFETYQFNTKTKEFTKNTLKSYFKGSERSIILYGQQRNLIFGVMESYPITVTDNYKGTVSSWTSEKHNYGFITVDDYLNSRANYKIFKPIFDVK